MIGKVYGQICAVNLHSDFIDNPSYFWEHERFHHQYELLEEYLDMPLRFQNLNKRLQVLNSFVDVLSTQTANSHSTKLEWYVIWLIVIEVVVQVGWGIICKDILGMTAGSAYDDDDLA
jgi:uncharacterized Rmd1/YagE family protein